MNQIKAVIFDLDGVLVETRQIHFEAFSLALEKLGISLSLKDHQRELDGLPTLKKIEILSRIHELSAEQMKFINHEKQRLTFEILENKITPNIEHYLIFEYLKKSNIQTAICSNTQRKTLDYLIDKLNIGKYLEFSISSSEVGSPKPSNEIYIKAVNQFNIDSQLVLAFEDSPYGIKAAQDANVNVVYIGTPSELTLEKIKKCLK